MELPISSLAALPLLMIANFSREMYSGMHEELRFAAKNACFPSEMRMVSIIRIRLDCVIDTSPTQRQIRGIYKV